MSRVLRNNGLSLTLFALFAIFLAAQSVTGWQVENAERAQHERASAGVQRLSAERAFHRGHLRELGERVPADGRLRPADGLSLPAGLVGIEGS